jgi:gamma-glutamyltranspeptidase / glutathione hydrolase
MMQTFTTRPEILGTFGVVTSTHWLATATGMAILEKGGNAFDAAVAAGFALQVVEPHLNGPGGDLPIILYSAGQDRIQVICGQGPAPQAATIDAFRALGLDLVPGAGLLAAVVPGAFDAWLLMLREHGSLPLGVVLAPAIGFARRGYPLVPGISAAIERVRDLFVAEWPTSAAVYLPGGALPVPGSLFRNERLADTYTRILALAESAGGDRERQIEAARRAWYQGFVAAAIDRFCREQELIDTSGRRHRGLLRADDLAGWRASVEEPLRYDYHGYTLCKAAPWSQAPVALQQLALLKGFDLSALVPESPEFVHTVVECAKLAFADREAFYGDPDFVEVPMATLLSEDYNDARRKLVGERASHELRPGRVEGHGGAVPLRARSSAEDVAHAGPAGRFAGAGEPTLAPVEDQALAGRGDTCHLDVIDRHGNMVSATPSGGWLQSSPVIPELGFCLGTRGQMFWLEEGRPSSLAPGKRPRTTLSPSLALRAGEPYLAFGTPGGDQQDQWALHVFLRHVHFGMNLQEAIDAPAFHTEHAPSSFYPREARPGHLALEGRFPAATGEELRRRGHEVEIVGDWSLGRVTAAARDGEVLRAAANPRLMQNYAIGR